jgi:GNAT superfamily N-acetyltransferase
MQLLDVANELPAEFEVLRAEARAEGYRHLDRLADEWGSGAARFNREGEKLVAAVLDGELAGIGGLTLDPEQPGALRMRRFYVSKAFRRIGIGRALAENLLAHAYAVQRPVTVNAAAAASSSGVLWVSSRMPATGTPMSFPHDLGSASDRRNGALMNRRIALLKFHTHWASEPKRPEVSGF